MNSFEQSDNNQSSPNHRRRPRYSGIHLAHGTNEQAVTLRGHEPPTLAELLQMIGLARITGDLPETAILIQRFLCAGGTQPERHDQQRWNKDILRSELEERQRQ